jgi:hypothetical protein
MSKKSDEKDKDKDKDERDLEDEAGDESTDKDEDEVEDEVEDEKDEEDEVEEGDDEVEAAPAKPVDRSRHVQDRRHAKREEDVEVEGEPPPQEDPTWWTPYAVLSALVLIGVLGFLGLFNNTPLARLAAPVAPAPAEEKHAAAPEEKPVAPPAQPRPGPTAQPREMFGAKHLLVMYKGSRRAPPNVERSKDEAKARAGEAMKKAKADPSKFADLVKEYSDEPGAAARGGDLGKFPKGAMVPEFQAGLDKIKVGEVSDLVETPFGFHVILRTQ